MPPGPLLDFHWLMRVPRKEEQGVNRCWVSFYLLEVKKFTLSFLEGKELGP